ncbi:MAG: hypothetical protein ACREXR_16060 [Gammaproteobacteria bacterium]
MNTKSLERVFAVALLFAGMGAAFPVLATPTGAQALGFAANSVDVFTFSCPAGFIGAAARVDDRDPPLNLALIQAVLSKDGIPTSQVTAPNDGGGTSLFAQVLDGPGSYAAVFKKTGLGVEAYSGDVFCVQASAPLNIILNVVNLQRRINQ